MGKITVELIRKRAEHNEGEIHSLEELALHQEKLEKIELLDKTCRNLRILLMQNNSISKIENVKRLKNLEYLNLAMNVIERIENLEGCEALTKLDLTLNFIGEISSVKYLKNNHLLEQLYLTGNPCTQFPGYREYVITILPQLQALDGQDITKSERIKARQKFQEIETRILLHEEACLHETNKNKPKIGVEASTSTSGLAKKSGESKDKEEDKDNNNNKNEGIDDNDDDDKAYWSQVTSNTPETRKEINKRLEQIEAEKALQRGGDVKAPLKPPPTKLEKDDGIPLNMNQPKVPFVLHDEVDRNQIVLDLAIPRHLCTSLINADVQPTYVRVTIKGKIFQLVLPEEIKPDSSFAQRSQTTGHLIITMPKFDETSTLIWKGGIKGPSITLTKKDKKEKESTSTTEPAEPEPVPEVVKKFRQQQEKCSNLSKPKISVTNSNTSSSVRPKSKNKKAGQGQGQKARLTVQEKESKGKVVRRVGSAIKTTKRSTYRDRDLLDDDDGDVPPLL